MLKWEICYSPVKLNEVSSENGLINKICRLFGISEDIATKEVQNEWVQWLFTSPFVQLTALEIFNAHKLALNGILLTEENKKFKIFPTLSTIQSAEILRSYIEYKRINSEYQKAKDKLKKLEQNKTEEQLKREQAKDLEIYVERLFNDLQNFGYTEKATHLYSKLYKLGKINITLQQAEELYKENLNKLLQTLNNRKELKDFIKQFDLRIIQKNERLTVSEIKQRMKTERISSVQIACRNICISNYLKNFDSKEKLKQEIIFLNNVI